jgi:hypothetical protein
MNEQQHHHRHVVLHVGYQNQNYQKLRKCSGCHAVQYCYPECQKNIGKLAILNLNCGKGSAGFFSLVI